MYSKKEIKALHQDFWTALGNYLAPIPALSGEKINWINYKTGVQGVRLLMDFNNEDCRMGLEFKDGQHNSAETLYMKFKALRSQFDDMVTVDVPWQESIEDNGSIHFYVHQSGLSIRNKADWPAAISFLKSNIIALDQFWSEFRFVFEDN